MVHSQHADREFPSLKAVSFDAFAKLVNPKIEGIKTIHSLFILPLHTIHCLIVNVVIRNRRQALPRTNQYPSHAVGLIGVGVGISSSNVENSADVKRPILPLRYQR